MYKPLIIYFNDEKMVNTAADQSNFLKRIKVLAKDNSLPVSSIEDFKTLIQHLPEEQKIFVFIHIMGDAIGKDNNGDNYEFQGKSWAVSLKQEYPNCNFYFVTSNLSHANQEIWDNKPAYNITDLMDLIFVKKSSDFEPQTITDIRSQLCKKGVTKPKVFIGSSVEGLDIARSIQAGLERDAHVTIWENGVFDEPGKSYIEILEEVLIKFEFGIFVFTPDDKVFIRNNETKIPRDNVIFEYGMFLGKHSRKKAFYIVPRDVDIHIMTDVLGLTCLDYDSTNEDLKSSVSVACNNIRGVIKKQ